MQHKTDDSLRKSLAPYEKSYMKSSVWQLINTIGPFILLWLLAYWTITASLSYWVTLPILIVTAGFLIRIFIIFHDCCHRSFFKNRLANEIIGTVTGILTCVPYHQWRHTHTIHHATSSNLDKRGVGDVRTLTVDEYNETSFFGRLAYRFYRNPIVMFGIGPSYIFLVDYRFNRKKAALKERINTYITNIGIIGGAALLCWLIGWQTFLLIQGPIFLVSGGLGIWLFYVQHTFEDSYFEHEEEWQYVHAAMQGSSYYKLPKVLTWITGNIGYHHVHHLSPRVPNYHLQEVHNKTPMLQKVPTIGIRKSLESLKFRVWSEQTKKFVTFKEARRFSKVKESVQESAQESVQESAAKVQTQA